MTSDKKHPTFSFQPMPSETFVHAKAYEDLLVRIAKLREALEFYAEPETYFAVGFFPDRPCGPFMEDFSDCVGEAMGETNKPGKRAREALQKLDSIMKDKK